MTIYIAQAANITHLTFLSGIKIRTKILIYFFITKSVIKTNKTTKIYIQNRKSIDIALHCTTSLDLSMTSLYNCGLEFYLFEIKHTFFSRGPLQDIS